MNTNLSTKNESVGGLLRAAQKTLAEADIDTARLDALVLLEDATGKNRAWLLANENFDLTTGQHRKFIRQIHRRQSHEPLAYIRGKTEFYGREFQVNPHTLEPRPETEAMIDLYKKHLAGKSLKIADVGTGSGAIGITIALETAAKNIDLIDIDTAALNIAKKNCAAYSLKLNCIKNDLLSGVNTTYDVILANLPYVPDGHTINQAAMQEPKHAIFGGPDGLDLYRRLFKQLKNASRPSACVLTESLPFQHDALQTIARSAGYRQSDKEDFIQIFSFGLPK